MMSGPLPSSVEPPSGVVGSGVVGSATTEVARVTRLNSTDCWKRVSHFFGRSITMLAVRSLVAKSPAVSIRSVSILSADSVSPAAN